MRQNPEPAKPRTSKTGPVKIDCTVKSLEPRLVKLFRTVGANNHSPAIRANVYSPLQRTRRESGDKNRLFTKPSKLEIRNIPAVIIPIERNAVHPLVEIVQIKIGITDGIEI